MDNEKVKAADRKAEDFMQAFAGAFEKNMLCEEENEASEAEDAFMSIGNRSQSAFEEPVRIEDDEESAPVLPAEPEPEPTARQIRKAEREAKKQAKWDKKEAKRNAKIERQQKNNTKVMLGGAVFLGVICIVLLVMNHFKLSFGDLPDVLSGEKSLATITTTMSLAINEQTESGPSAPPKGDYVIIVEDGVYLRESASTSASRVAVLEKGTKITISAFRYDSENECFWGRTGFNGNYGWVMMTALAADETSADEPTSVESLG